MPLFLDAMRASIDETKTGIHVARLCASCSKYALG